MIRLEYRDARPIYEQVRDGLRSLMVTGVLAAGEITRFTAELCRDSGEKALAVTVELCGAAAAGLALLPLAKRALELIGSIGG